MELPKTLAWPGGARRQRAASLQRHLPFLNWLFHYQRENLVGDLMAGAIVAVMLIPQGMAYAMLAGLPPQTGLYASIAPLMVYGLLGTSRSLSVGPVAIMSLMTASGVGALAAEGTAEYVSLALTLALLLGAIQLLMGVARLGFLVNFLSHPVLSGFMNAAALVIGASQLKHLLGVSVTNSETLTGTLRQLAGQLGSTNLPTLALGVGSIVTLVYFKRWLGGQLERNGVAGSVVAALTKAGPLVVVVMATLITAGLALDEHASVRVVGDIPSGLPGVVLPAVDPDRLVALLPTAIALSLVGFMESISVARSLASKRREKIDANQELVALGAANVGAAFTGGFPVTGGLSRSVVNHSAGANTGLASILTALLVAVTLLAFTSLFYYLPQAVLAAIVVVAVSSLIDIKPLQHAWTVNKSDALALLATFAGVLLLGVETGILVGVAAALVLHLWRTSRPHIAVVGRLGDSEIYRNVLRYDVQTHPEVVALRIDESLYFANARALEETLLAILADRPDVREIVLIGSAINAIDLSGLETLESVLSELNDAGVGLSLAEFKGPVIDTLRRAKFIHLLGEERLYVTTHQAMRGLGFA